MSALAVLALLPASAFAVTDVVVQGTTDVRDAGLVDDVIVPGFEAAYPQYNLQYIAVGTGQALANARAGQGDAVLTHSPPLEAQFVADGFSYESTGRAVMYNDYVLNGHDADPAGVVAGARHDAVHALELIAQAGTGGTAVFVSRGDESGTHVQENLLWAKTNVPTHPIGAAGSGRAEPDGNGDGMGTDVPDWYEKTGTGQAATLKTAEQCTFDGGSVDRCYEMTDRGTFNHQIAIGAIAGMKIVSDRNAPEAPGGERLQLNQFNVYAVNPAKVSSVKLDGALAFLDYLTSAGFQDRLTTYPSAVEPAFFPDAYPLISGVGGLPASVEAGQAISVSGMVSNRFPGSLALAGAPLALEATLGLAGSPFGPLAPGLDSLAQANASTAGAFALTGTPARSGAVSVAALRNGALSATRLVLGDVRVQAVLELQQVSASYRKLRLRGTALPDRQRSVPKLVVLGRKAGSSAEKRLGSVSLPAQGQAFDVSVAVAPGRWRVRAQYEDPAAVEPSEITAARTVSVPGASKVGIGTLTRLSGHRLRFAGELTPAAKGGKGSRVVVRGRRLVKGRKTTFRALKLVKLRKGQQRYSITIKLKPGTWQLRTSYEQPGATDASRSPARTVRVR